MSPPPPVPGLAESARLLASGEASPVDLVRMSLARIETLESALHAFIRVLPERAMHSARQAETDWSAGRAGGPLHGVPYALKDIIDVAGIATTAHSRLRMHHVASRDAGLAERLERAGLVLMGKLSLHEFARGAPSDVLPWPNARNPWDVTRACGGSSSGSGVAVAAGMVALAPGTDTGGSIRVPAAFTGTVGLKPTYGRISRRGIFPLSYSLDHAGPITRTVEDCALALQVMAGFDPDDPGSADVPVPDYSSALHAPLKGRRIGLARAYNAAYQIDAQQEAAVESAARLLRDLGCIVEDITLPPVPQLDAATWTIILAEGFAVHQHDLRTRPQDYGRTVRERMSIGAFVTGSDLVQAQRWRRTLAHQMDRCFDRCDAILCATSGGPPPLVAQVDDAPWRRRQPITGPFNLTGHPALAVPAGLSSEGLPLSVQFIGRAFAEANLLNIAFAHEQAAGWHRLRPPEASLPRAA